MKLSKIYTRTGDLGLTSLVGGIRISKDSERIEAYGTIDELSSNLGLLASLINEGPAELQDSGKQITAVIERIQNNLFNVSTYLATDTSQTPIYPSAKFNPEEITFIENEIDRINSSLPELNSFIIPGGCLCSSQCHVCRTVCRRAERRIVKLISTLTASTNETEAFNSDILKYINRISDYLFVLARNLNFLYNTEEKTWKNTCR